MPNTILNYFFDAIIRTVTVLKILSSLVVWIFDELDDDIFAWLNLEHFEYEAQESGWLDVPAKDSAHMVQVHRLVNQQLGYEQMREYLSGRHIGPSKNFIN